MKADYATHECLFRENFLATSMLLKGKAHF